MIPKIEQLNEMHFDIINVFSCIEEKDMLQHLNSKERRKTIRHSKEMNTFIKQEALFEQINGLSTTHLLIDTSLNKLVGYISLCNDTLELATNEMLVFQSKYKVIPAVKIARLAIDINYRNKGLGKYLIGYSAILVDCVKDYSGVAIITLDCYEDKESYYTKLGFIKNINQPIKRNFDSLISLSITLPKLLDILSNFNQEEIKL